MDSQPPSAQPQVNGSSQLPVTAPQQQRTGPSPLPQQIQQFSTAVASPSPLPTSQSQQPQYPPGVKVSETSTNDAYIQLRDVQQLQTPTVQRPPSAVATQQASQHLQSRSTAPSAFPGS